MSSVKCVVVGSIGVGKTSLVHRLSKGEFLSTENIPSLHECCLDERKVNANAVELGVWDTSAMVQSFARTNLFYPNADVFIICYDAENSTSMEEVVEKWYPEIKRFEPNQPIVVVRTQVDKVSTKKEKELKTFLEKMANVVKPVESFEVSSKTGDGIENLFQTVSEIGLDYKQSKKEHLSPEEKASVLLKFIINESKTMFTSLESNLLLTFKDLNPLTEAQLENAGITKADDTSKALGALVKALFDPSAKNVANCQKDLSSVLQRNPASLMGFGFGNGGMPPNLEKNLDEAMGQLTNGLGELFGGNLDGDDDSGDGKGPKKKGSCVIS